MGESSPSSTHSCEDSTISTSQELSSEETEPFNCSICLELVYKPIVQACGHIFCFWCAYQAMNVRKESHCPVCRRPYKYFPRVCELLHFALSKAVPEEYERRGREVQRTEEQKQVFSPRLVESPRQVWSPRSFDEAAGFSSLQSTPRGVAALTVNSSAGKITPASVLCSQSEDRFEDMGCARRDAAFMQKAVSVDDFRCSNCNDLLHRPVVLNCGEVFCEPCLKDTPSKVIYCPSCKAPHSGNSTFICLELNQFLEGAFPMEYSRRKGQHLAETIQPAYCENEPLGDLKAEKVLHVGVGCDGCGMYPIEGFRYRCVECTEKIGFDLCGDCYRRGGNVMGRFNQEHRPNHHMEQIQQRVHRPLDFNMHNSSIQRRRQQQQTANDLDDYINSFVE
ncbi:hypothetical protein GOP47_0017525 [Adiantum capillus-veneris]|uniref:E3 ubiquitin-protein ligase PRT1 n=1 Tax=Adiantum capillus-veneris TaxID=13818 RepID=A0A9D4ZAN7_ADICA|nr:hypothetical protein GOP47_0017525 [Adiantum capillus-veneris]